MHRFRPALTLRAAHTAGLRFASRPPSHHPRSPKPVGDVSPIDCESLADGESPQRLPHPIWTQEELDNVQVKHTPPQDLQDKIAYFSVQTVRQFFDLISGYTLGRMTEEKWLRRLVFLETIAGVPGMVASMMRHLKSLRTLSRDGGWIHTLLEEAENERMHLMVVMEMKQATLMLRACVVTAQGIFTTLFAIAYLLSPRFCHRFVGYLEEEAVKTYTHCLQEIDRGGLPMFKQMSATPVAKQYWCLPDDAMWRDVIRALRADEAHHRDVNHHFSDVKCTGRNPFGWGR